MTLKFSSIQTLTVGTVVSTVPPLACSLRVADFTASGDFHPAPEILTSTKIIKKIYQVLKRGEKITLENRDRPWSREREGP